MIGMESFGVEGEYKSLTFVYSDSPPLEAGDLYKLNNTAGLIFVAEKIDLDTGCRADLTVEPGETGVLIYSCEKIQLPKQAVVILTGQALYWNGVTGTGVTNVWATGLFQIGIAVAGAALADANVLSDLSGDHCDDEVAP